MRNDMGAKVRRFRERGETGGEGTRKGAGREGGRREERGAASRGEAETETEEETGKGRAIMEWNV